MGSGVGPASPYWAPAAGAPGATAGTTGVWPAAGPISGSSSQTRTIRRVRLSRPWLSTRGPISRQTVRLSFWLARPATVVVRVDELAPDCRYAGKFLVRGHAGRNVVRFRGRLRGRKLDPGTYRLIAHPRGQRGHRLDRVTVVVLSRPPGGAAEVRAAQARNECPAGISPSQQELISAPLAQGDGDEGTAAKGIAGAKSTKASGLIAAVAPIKGPLFKAVGTVEDAARAIPPALFAMAALAVLLLALASMPQFGAPTRAGAMLVHKRASIAMAGGAALLTAIATYLVLLAL